MEYFDSTYNDFIFPDDREEAESIVRERFGYADSISDFELRLDVETVVRENKKEHSNKRVQDILSTQRVIRDGSSYWDSYNDSRHHDSHYDRHDDYGDNSYYHDVHRDSMAVLTPISTKKPQIQSKNKRVQDILGSQRVIRDGSSHWDSYNDSYYHDNYNDRYDDYGDSSYYHDSYRDGMVEDKPKQKKKTI